MAEITPVNALTICIRCRAAPPSAPGVSLCSDCLEHQLVAERLRHEQRMRETILAERRQRRFARLFGSDK